MDDAKDIVATGNGLRHLVVVPDSRRQRILFAESSGGKLSLPSWHAEPTAWQDVREVNAVMKRRFGLETIVLRCLGNRPVGGFGQPLRIYELETIDGDNREAPAGYVWVEISQVETCPIAETEHRLLTLSWLAEETRLPHERGLLPWMRHGWFPDASKWIRATTERLAIRIEGNVEQLRTSLRGVTYLVPTDRGDIYFRAARPTTDINERLLQWELSPWFSEHMPGYVALDGRRNWSLTSPSVVALEFEESDDLTDGAEIAEAATAFAHLQQETVWQLPTYLELGIPDRRLSVLRRNIALLLTETERRRDLFTDADIRAFNDALLPLVQTCEDLGKFNLPAVLEYGDFTPGATPAWPSLVFPEFSDPCITHPFFRFAQPPFQPQAYDEDPYLWRARNAYLHAWDEFEPQDRLNEAFHMAWVLAPLHYASATIYIQPADTQTQWEVDSMLSCYVKTTLARFARSPLAEP